MAAHLWRHRSGGCRLRLPDTYGPRAMSARQLCLEFEHNGLKGGRIDAAPSAISSTDDSVAILVASHSQLSEETSTAATTTTRQRSTVLEGAETPKIDSHPVQWGLSGLREDKLNAPRRPHLSVRSRQEAKPLLALYERRIAARWTVKTRQKYTWVLRNLLDLASNLAGHSVAIIELLRDEPLLGRTLATATTADGSRQISACVAAQRRSVLRSFTQLLEPELRREGITDAGDALVRALRSVAEPVGTGYRLPVGTPRGRGGPTPPNEELAAIRDELGRKPGWRGTRNEIMLSLMTRRGVRIGGLLGLDGASAHRLPHGRVRCLLRAKSAREPYELAVPDDLIGPLVRYVEQFNAWARASGLPDRIGFGTPGRFWRNDFGRPLTYQTWTTELKQACVSAGLPVYTSHAFCRAFATTSTMAAPRATVASAGNWTSTRRMDDHYVRPSITRLRQSVARLPSRPQQALPVETDSPVPSQVGRPP